MCASSMKENRQCCQYSNLNYFQLRGTLVLAAGVSLVHVWVEQQIATVDGWIPCTYLLTHKLQGVF